MPNERDRQSNKDQEETGWVQHFKNELRLCPTLKEEEEFVLAELSTKDAKAKLIEGNLKTVFINAVQCLRKGTDLGDLIQDGYFGLRKAVEDFDPARKVPFNQFAKLPIKQFIIKGIEDRRIGLKRRSVHGTEVRPKIVGEVGRHLAQQLRREPTREEIAEDLTRRYHPELDHEQRNEIVQAFVDAIESIQPVDEVSEDEMSTVERDPTVVAEQRERIYKALSRLGEQDRRIFLQYWRGYTQTQIAAMEDIPENTVKSRIFRAREKLKNEV